MRWRNRRIILHANAFNFDALEDLKEV